MSDALLELYTELEHIGRQVNALKHRVGEVIAARISDAERVELQRILTEQQRVEDCEVAASFGGCLSPEVTFNAAPTLRHDCAIPDDFSERVLSCGE